MNTIYAKAPFLSDLLELLVSSIMPPHVKHQLQMLVQNQYGGDDVELQERNKVAVLRLIDDLSRLALLPDEAEKRFNKESLQVKLCFYDRYCLALDLLKEYKSKGILLNVPSTLDGLFRWFFIELWDESWCGLKPT